MRALLTILAAAGGGSGGYGGGGGGGGGGSGFGGGGSRGGSLPLWAWVLIAAGIVVFFLAGAISAHRYRRARAERVRRTELAAAEAAGDDADFDPETVRAAAARLFCEVQERWTANDVAGLAAMVGEDLMVEWRRRLDDFARKGWHNVCEVHGAPDVEYVGLVNREGEDEDRVVVRITAKLEDYVRDARGDVVAKDGEKSTSTTLREWWTLQPPGARWRVVSIEQEAEGRHHLDAPLVPVPWSDDRVRDAALVETAVADAVPAGVAVAEIAPAVVDEDARAAALDLSLADARFAPDVLEVAARRAVEAWVEAVDGSDAALEALADRAAVDALLHGGDASGRTRVVVRGARVTALRVTGVDARAAPARMTAVVTVRGRRYVEDRDTTDVVGGSKDADRETVQEWTFALSGDDATPWRLVTVR